MLRAYAFEFGKAMTAIVEMKWGLKAWQSEPDFVNETIVTKTEQHLTTIRSHCDKLLMSSAVAKIDSTISDVKSLPRRLISERLVYALQEIQERIAHELQTKLFYYVPAGNAEYYQRPDLFGPDVTEKLPNALADIEEAGNCLALVRPTACVLHLMRVLEVGINAFAAHPKLNHTPNHNHTMGKIATDLQNKANALPATTHAEQQEREALQGIAIHFKAVTGAWRNPNMHTTATYTQEQAKLIFDYTKAFMSALAAIL